MTAIEIAMLAGARAIETSKRLHGSAYSVGYSAEYCETMPYVTAAKVLRGAAEKYRWHDLRKDPEDLPDPDSLGDCLVLTPSLDADGKGFFAMTMPKQLVRKNGADGLNIAWKELEPLEDVGWNL